MRWSPTKLPLVGSIRMVSEIAWLPLLALNELDEYVWVWLEKVYRTQEFRYWGNENGREEWGSIALFSYIPSRSRFLQVQRRSK